MRRAPALAVLGSACACSEIVLGEDKDSCELAVPEDRRHNVHVVTFWTEGPERDALLVLRRKLNAEEGNLTWTEKDNRTDLQNGLFVDGQPEPDVYQVNGGSDVLQFALGPQDQTKICSLDKLFESYDLEDHYFESAWKPSMCHGSHFAIPLNIHRVNTMMVNTELYDRARAQASEDEPLLPLEKMRNAEDLISALERIATLGLEVDEKPLVPLSIGIGDDTGERLTNTWPLIILAYEGLLASYPHRAYESIWKGEGEFEDVADELELLTEHVSRLGRVSNIREGLSWQQATREVLEGRAVLTINGDWIFAQLSDEKAPIEMMVFPNSAGTFVYTPDSFAVPRLKGKTGSDAHGWFRDVTDDTFTQLSFSQKKKGIPAKRKIDPEELESEYLTKTYEEFSSCQPGEEGAESGACRLLLAVSGLAPGEGHDPCFDRTGMLLAMLSGIAYDDEDWEVATTRKQCRYPVPQARSEAKTQLLSILEDVSNNPFAQECRTP